MSELLILILPLSTYSSQIPHFSNYQQSPVAQASNWEVIFHFFLFLSLSASSIVLLFRTNIEDFLSPSSSSATTNQHSLLAATIALSLFSLYPRQSGSGACASDHFQ